MKQNSAEQPYEAYERLKNELEEVNNNLEFFKRFENKNSYKFLIICVSMISRQSITLNDQTKLALIEVLESKKQQIENELNKLLNGN